MAKPNFSRCIEKATELLYEQDVSNRIRHIYFGHTKDRDVEEVEAHFRASQLFMSEYSLYMTAKEYGELSCDDVVEIFVCHLKLHAAA